MTLRLKGSNSGDVSLKAPATAGNNTITLPTSNGSAEQFLKNSGTAGELEYSSMIEDSSGNLGIGNTNPSDYASGAENLVVGNTSSANGITILTGTGNAGGINFADGTSGADRGRLDYDHGDDRMRFNTAATERLRIESNGRSMFFATEAVTYMKSDASAGTTHALITGVHGGGSVSLRVWTNGNIQNTNNSYGSLSDSKLKENIVDANSQWDDIKGIRVRNYNFIEGQTHTQLGVVAQEVETVSPGLVYETPDRDSEGTDLGTVTKSVNYSVLYMKAVKALQEAQTRIETLETQNTAQQTQIDDLLARVTALEAA